MIFQKRKWIVFIAVNAIVAFGILFFGKYKAIADALPWIAPCLLKMIFRIYCPLCGMTRSMGALLHGDIISSFLNNPGVIVGAAVFILCDITALIALISKNNKIFRLIRPAIIIYLAFLILFFIVRNILLVFFGIDYIGDLADFWS